MSSPDPPNIKRSRLRIGPGLLLALVIAGAILASGSLFDNKHTDPAAGNIVWEADAQGHLRRVHAVATVKQAPLPRLWKPEVGLLVRDAVQLVLTTAQRARLEALDAAWQHDRAQLETQMSAASADAQAVVTRATPERAASATQILQRLGDYSTLSTQYDLRRTSYWMQGTALLTPEQHKTLERLTEAAQR